MLHALSIAFITACRIENYSECRIEKALLILVSNTIKKFFSEPNCCHLTFCGGLHPETAELPDSLNCCHLTNCGDLHHHLMGVLGCPTVVTLRIVVT